MKKFNQYKEFLEGIRWYQDGKFMPEEESNYNEYNDFITDDEFRQFLIDNDCYDKYIKNYTNYENRQDLEERFKSIRRDEYLSSANVFLWRDTIEGYRFWRELSDKWKDVI